MKNSKPSLLIGIVAVLVVADLALSWAYGRNMRMVRNLQPAVPQIQQNRLYATALANDVMEYGKTHPDILPILEAAMKKTGSAPAHTAKPATK